VSEPLEDVRRVFAGTLPGLLGIEVLAVSPGAVEARMPLRGDHTAPITGGRLHGGATVSLADTCCGVGSMTSLPEGMGGFTTLELKTNFLRAAAPPDALRCAAALVHDGRTTQVWDATVTRESDGETIALVRCTQYLLPGAP
jgi:uncharacterized protein (TIGR00369 family)